MIEIPDDVLAMCRSAVGELLRANTGPQRLNYFFKSSGHKNAWVKWQTAFMNVLASKNAIMASEGHYIRKNRFFLETLWKSENIEQLITIVTEACGVDPLTMNSKSIPPPPSSPPTLEFANEVEPNIKDTIALLEKLQDLMIKSMEIQVAVAENVLHVRDRFETRQTKLVDRVKGLDDRLAAIEAKLDAQPDSRVVTSAAGISQESIESIAEIVSDSVSSMRGTVDNIKEEVQLAMQSAIQNTDRDRMANIKESLSKITSEFVALRELTLESLSETPR
jgi:hypothetical protein